MSHLDRQVGGTHYKDLAIQPVEYITKNKIPFLEGNIIKYVTRWASKGGVEDLRKAQHYLDLLMEFNCGVDQQEDRLSHKQEVAGSNPAPASKHSHYFISVINGDNSISYICDCGEEISPGLMVGLPP